MFRRLETNLPKEPYYEATLNGLGYKLEHGKFVRVSDGTIFPYHSTSNERVNELHREAMHSAVRHAVSKAAAERGVIEVYLSGKDGAEMSTMKPKGQHIKVMATELELLKEKRNVVVVVGESMQDLGVWAWRDVMGEGGLNSGSVVGLVKELEKMRFGAHAPISREGEAEGPRVATAAYDPKAEDVPGLIIFNPGQLLYSHDHSACMTYRSWMARPKSSVIGSPYQIHSEFNMIEGHTNPDQHVETMFEKVLPQMLGNAKEGKGVRLFVVGLGDGAQKVVDYMDGKMSHDNWAKIGGLVTALAFTEPTFDPDKIQSDALRITLANFAKSWIKSSKPVGTWINYPTGMDLIALDPELSPIADDNDSLTTDSYDHLNSVVSCHTYSGGTDEDEIIFPNVRDEVLDWFKVVADREDRALLSVRIIGLGETRERRQIISAMRLAIENTSWSGAAQRL